MPSPGAAWRRWPAGQPRWPRGAVQLADGWASQRRKRSSTNGTRAGQSPWLGCDNRVRLRLQVVIGAPSPSWRRVAAQVASASPTRLRSRRMMAPLRRSRAVMG
jgi:hypothetical protein